MSVDRKPKNQTFSTHQFCGSIDSIRRAYARLGYLHSTFYNIDVLIHYYIFINVDCNICSIPDRIITKKCDGQVYAFVFNVHSITERMNQRRNEM